MSGLGFFGNSILSVAGTAVIYAAAFKNPGLLRELVKNPSFFKNELDLMYVGTRAANRILQTRRDDATHPHNTPSQGHPSAQEAAQNAGQSLNQAA
ncbi:MAG: hypothetical protein A3I68_00120 [Candidatus Melainabacteria bacterium RIFCSPLOWO2_02_FULL_35_15]|nr:MAG: hypothetical protein A3F80_00900 [Candidatus Melainabacteria bacterium RIFCSPLOWO2_12_FULL_35_11]OGI14800.1 MAG: hypothetical protein A3I68_00120 [Candidatus Melainabacteria bacterium RIFCSPLOWO2_02_FULL_35_15]